MTTRDHLVYRMQELYSFQRDYLALLDGMLHTTEHAALRAALQCEHDGIKGELEPLERALNVLGARFKMERSVLVPALEEMIARFKQQMNPSRAQLDIHTVLLALDVSLLNIHGYESDIELALVIGEQDVVTLLRENLRRQIQGKDALQALAPTLIREVGGDEIQRAA